MAKKKVAKKKPVKKSAVVRSPAEQKKFEDRKRTYMRAYMAKWREKQKKGKAGAKIVCSPLKPADKLKPGPKTEWIKESKPVKKSPAKKPAKKKAVKKTAEKKPEPASV